MDIKIEETQLKLEDESVKAEFEFSKLPCNKPIPDVGDSIIKAAGSAMTPAS